MSRTGIGPETLAQSLRRMAGNGSIEWVMEPLQASVLLDIADMLEENAKLREERDMYRDLVGYMVHPDIPDQLHAENVKLRELVRDMYKSMDMSCQFNHAIPAGTMAHIKNRVIGLGAERDG